MPLLRPRLAALCGAALLAVPLTATSTAVAAPSARCGGALLPDEYAVDHGLPHKGHTPYTPAWLYNPQTISGFVQLASRDVRNSAEQRACLARLGAQALVDGSETRTVTTADGTATARLFPYPFAFSANPSTPTLASGWHSGLGQGSVLRAMLAARAATGDAAWLDVGREVLNSFDLAPQEGGFVTREKGFTYFQEYPTVPHGYVLNGQQETLISLYTWARFTGDQHAQALADEGMESTRQLYDLYEVALPQGILTSYDLLRGRTLAAPFRVLAQGRAAVSAASSTDPSGGRYGPMVLPVATSTVAGPNLVADSGFSAWTAGRPTAWPLRPSSGAVRGVTERGNVFLRLTATKTQTPGAGQRIPASRLTPGGTYRLTFRARTVIPKGQAGTSGRYSVTAACGSSTVALGSQGTIRGTTWAAYDVAVTLPRGRSCSMTVAFAPVSPISGSSLDVDAVSLSLTSAAPGVGRPRLPLSVLAVPRPQLAVTYTGAGTLQAWREGRWVNAGRLPNAARSRTVTVDVPAWAQGRTVNWGYHEIHVAELFELGRLLSDPVLLGRGARWAPQAPACHGMSFTP